MNAESTIDKRADHGFFAQNVDGLVLSDVSVKWNEKKTEKKWQDAFSFYNINGLHLSGLKGKQAPTAKDGSLIVLKKVNDAIVERCMPEKGTASFLTVGKSCKDIYQSNNFTGKTLRMSKK